MAIINDSDAASKSNSGAFSPAAYWEKRLQSRFDLTGVGHISFSHSYNNWLYRRRYDQFKRIAKQYNIRDQSILDIGAGTGFWIQPCRDLQCRYTGVDITDASVQALSQRHPDCRFYRADISSNEVGVPGTFDLFNIWDVLYHVVDDDGFARVAKNIRSLAAPGALVIATDCFGAPADTRSATHVRFRCLQSYQSVWNDCGFELACQRPLFSYLNNRISALGRFNNALGPIAYLVDSMLSRPSTSNLSIAVWRLKA